MKKLKTVSKGFIIGFLAASLIFGTTAFAANKQLLVDIANFKFMFNDVEKRQESGGLSFIYKGTTYVPLRFVSEGLGEKVEYDGKNKTIWVGKRSGANVSLTSIDYARYDAYNSKMWINESDKKITGTSYKNNIVTYVRSKWEDEKTSSIEYNLDGKYKSLSALIGVEEASRNEQGSFSITFYGDGVEIDSFHNLRGGDHALPVNINIEGVLKLKIEFHANDGGSYLMVAEPKLFQ